MLLCVGWGTVRRRCLHRCRRGRGCVRWGVVLLLLHGLLLRGLLLRVLILLLVLVLLRLGLRLGLRLCLGL